jgi:hypothetical protein
MGTKKQQERKKKQREIKGRARVLSRRNKLREDMRNERQSARLNMRFREKIKPIIKDPEKKAAIEEAEKNRALERLQRNAEILKALEKQYQDDLDAKKSINEALEAEGHFELKDKFNALESKARDIVNPEAPDQA